MQSPRQGLLIILDGLGDRPIPAFGGATPLEAASTPNLDRLVARGKCGLVDPGIPDLPVSTHSGTGMLLGIDPDHIRRLARGPVEAAGIGLELADGEVAVRCNFATLVRRDGALWVLDRRAGRIGAEARELASALRDIPLGDGVVANLHPATQHRAVLCLSGGGLSGGISDTDPGERAPLPARVLESQPRRGQDPSVLRTARALNRFALHAFERLVDHPVNETRRARNALPANGIICREAGTSTRIPSLMARIGLNTAMVAGECTLLGMGRLLGHTLFTGPRFSALPDTDLDAKMDAVHAALESHDLVVLHVKGTDICAHDRDPAGKRAFLERIDRAVTRLPIEDLVIAVTGDHCTDSNTGYHVSDPVPSLLFAGGEDADDCQTFGESQSAGGALGYISGTAFLASFLEAMGCLDGRHAEVPK